MTTKPTHATPSDQRPTPGPRLMYANPGVTGHQQRCPARPALALAGEPLDEGGGVPAELHRLLYAWIWLHVHDHADPDWPSWWADLRARRSAMTPAELEADTAAKRHYMQAHQAEWDAKDRADRLEEAKLLGVAAENPTWSELRAARKAERQRRAKLPLRRALDGVDPRLLDALGVDLTPDLRVVK